MVSIGFLMSYHHGKLTGGRTHAKKSPNRASEVQLLLDCDSARLPATVDAAGQDDPTARFALRFAALLENDPSVRLQNSAVPDLAGEILGAAARDAYDAAEAGLNLYLGRSGLEVTRPRVALDRLLLQIDGRP